MLEGPTGASLRLSLRFSKVDEGSEPAAGFERTASVPVGTTADGAEGGGRDELERSTERFAPQTCSTPVKDGQVCRSTLLEGPIDLQAGEGSAPPARRKNKFKFKRFQRGPTSTEDGEVTHILWHGAIQRRFPCVPGRRVRVPGVQRRSRHREGGQDGCRER